MLYKAVDQLGNAGGDEGEECNKGEKHLHQEAERLCSHERRGLATVVGKAFGDHFAEQENDQRGDHRTPKGDLCRGSKETGGDQGCH